MINPDTIADSKIADPVADSQFNVKTAASAFFSNATGGPRNTRLFNPPTSNLKMESLFSQVFISVRPQVKTNKLRITHGNQAIQTCLPTTVADFEAPSI